MMGDDDDRSSDSGSISQAKFVCTSVQLHAIECGKIDKVMLTSDQENRRTCKTRVTKTCRVNLGDKFSTRYGQKGTVGSTQPEYDLPFAEDGQVPDWILNMLAFTSRGTWGEFLETMLAMVCAFNGRFGDATPYSHLYRDALYRTVEDRLRYLRPGKTIDEIGEALKHIGMSPSGETVLYSGATGERLKGKSFMGICFVQRLRHMTDDKWRARPRGKVQVLTRQPNEGRKKDGGIRFGEMERDCLLSHGAGSLMSDIFKWNADVDPVKICRICHTSVYAHENGKVYCRYCDLFDTALEDYVPYVSNLWKHELSAMGFNLKFHIREC